MPTKVLVFESDVGFAEQLREGLAQFACDTTVVDDASLGLQTAAKVRPDLILLAIELPRMNGFSVCNKLKRDPGLKDIPLIIMSSDSSEETFEQHRRLRTRAEDYVHKPVAFHELLGRIQTFVPLSDGGGETALGVDDIIVDDIIVEDDIEIEDASQFDGIEIADAEILDAEVDMGRLTDQVFESLQSQPPAEAAIEGEIEIAEAEVLSEEPLEGGLDGSLDGLGPNELTDPSFLEEPEPTSDLEIALSSELSLSDYELAAPPAYPEELAPEPPLASPSTLARNSAPPAVGESAPAPSTPSSPFPPRSAGPRAAASRPAASRPPEADGQRLRDELDRHRSRVRELEEEARESRAKLADFEDAVRRGGQKDHEVQRLHRELDDVKSRLSSGKGAGSAREFLDLREQLNRKDKEILDLRDQLTHRDKELLAFRDSSLALERERADLLDRTSDLERTTSELTRTNEALRDDKEAAGKRADDFKKKSERLKAELDAKSVEYVDLKQQFDSELASWTTREAEFDARAQAELEKAVLATEATERSRGEQLLLEATEQARAEHAAVLSELRAQADADKAEAVRARDAELTEQYEMRLVGLERAGQETVLKLKAEQEQALAEAEHAASERLGARESELEAVRQRELEAARKDYETRMLELQASHTAQLNDRAQTISALERDLALRTAQRDDARRDIEKRDLRIEGLETDFTGTREKLEMIAANLAEREQTVASLRAELDEKTNLAADLATRLDQTAQRLATVEVDFSAAAGELEQTRATLQRDTELLSRARGKWEGDRSSLERAKDALAAALAQIDEIEARALE